MKETATPMDAYAESVGARKQMIKLAGDKLPGDPRRIADAVLLVAEAEEPPLHLLLGRDVLAAFRQKLADWQTTIDTWESVTKDVNFPV